MDLHSSPFLQLPAEVRLQIYALVLPYSEYDAESEILDCPVKWHHGNCPSILFVNRRIHREATSVLYRENIFAIYVKHPRRPRLPMNESRADPESFILISWAKKSWANPRNPKLPYSVLRSHHNFQDIRRFHVSLPPFDDLLGIDMYMLKSSYAAFNGINGWVRKCSKQGGHIDAQERERMDYIQRTKGPIDEIAALLQNLPRIEELHLGFQQPLQREISFGTYLLRGMIALRDIKKARCFYVTICHQHPSGQRVFTIPTNTVPPNLERLLEDPSTEGETSHLSEDVEEMLFLLLSIRSRQQLDPAALPDWLTAMTA